MKMELKQIYSELIEKFPTIYEFVIKKSFKKYTKEHLKL